MSNTDFDAEKFKAFILELNELTRKHGYIIGGCGECGSPWVVEAEAPDLVEGAGYGFQQAPTDHLTWICPTGWESRNNYAPITRDSVRDDETGRWVNP